MVLQIITGKWQIFIFKHLRIHSINHLQNVLILFQIYLVQILVHRTFSHNLFYQEHLLIKLKYNLKNRKQEQHQQDQHKIIKDQHQEEKQCKQEQHRDINLNYLSYKQILINHQLLIILSIILLTLCLQLFKYL